MSRLSEFVNESLKLQQGKCARSGGNEFQARMVMYCSCACSWINDAWWVLVTSGCNEIFWNYNWNHFVVGFVENYKSFWLFSVAVMLAVSDCQAWALCYRDTSVIKQVPFHCTFIKVCMSFWT